MPALFAIALGLVTSLVLARRKVPMGAAFVVGAAVLGLASGQGVSGTLEGLYRALTHQSTLAFAILVFVVFTLTAVLRRLGSLEVLVQGAGHFIKSRRLRLASLPALVGLLPMPGGAVVSAPLLDRTATDCALDGSTKNVINYWFRHVWEICWPLYPSVLLAGNFLDGQVTRFSLTMLPLCLLLILCGYVFVLRRVPRGRDKVLVERPDRSLLALAVLPIIIGVSCVPLTTWLWRDLLHGPRPAEAGLATGLFLGITTVAWRRGGTKAIATAVTEKTTWVLVALAVGVKTFGTVVEMSGVASRTARELLDLGLPMLSAALILPFVIGFATGNTVATVSVSFPILLAMFQGQEGTGLFAPMVFAYASGFFGYMLSPVHMCLVLSSRFFGAPMARAYRPLMTPLIVFLAGSSVLYLALKTWSSN